MTEEQREEIRDRLRQVQREFGYTSHAAFASALGLSRQAVTQWFGKRTLGLDGLRALASLGVNLNWLLVGQGSMRPDEDAAAIRAELVRELEEEFGESIGKAGVQRAVPQVASLRASLLAAARITLIEQTLSRTASLRAGGWEHIRKNLPPQDQPLLQSLVESERQVTRSGRALREVMPAKAKRLAAAVRAEEKLSRLAREG